ncbi:MICOS complex subunit mic25-like [Clavelina lepadiformis]|uniref:MICOS complex subunit mic25-like n=1 Tax=Clavelina lepadiformis TaxID=159417 RepID=UPI0040428D15
MLIMFLGDFKRIRFLLQNQVVLVMGNNASSEVTIDRDAENFIKTGDGIKLSPSILQRMSEEEGQGDGQDIHRIPNETTSVQESESVKEAQQLAEDRQKILDEREKQLSLLNEKWEKELSKERAKQQKFHDLTVEAFEQSAKEVEEKFKHPELKPVCKNLQDAMLECYRNNNGRILDCSQSVKNFQNCVVTAKESFLKEPRGV